MGALLAFLLLAAPAGAQEWSDFNRRYLETVVKLLKRLPSTQAHWAYVARTKIPLRVSDDITRVDDHMVASFDPVRRNIHIDEVRLIQEAEALTDQGVSSATVAEVLAWKSLPVVVHEIAHALNAEGASKAAGGAFLFRELEDEVVAFYDGLLALFDMIREKPELWREDRILEIDKVEADYLREWLKGADDLEATVEAVYHRNTRLLKAEPERLLASLERDIAAAEDVLAVLRSGEPFSSRSFASAADAEDYFRRVAAMKRATRAAVADPARFARVKAYYRDALADRRARLESRRPGAR